MLCKFCNKLVSITDNNAENEFECFNHENIKVMIRVYDDRQDFVFSSKDYSLYVYSFLKHSNLYIGTFNHYFKIIDKTITPDNLHQKISMYLTFQ